MSSHPPPPTPTMSPSPPPPTCFARPRTTPTPQTSMSATYWQRLRALLSDAHAALPTLHRPSDRPSDPLSPRTPASAIALSLQGRPPAHVTPRLAHISADPVHAHASHGAFVVYGVPSTHAAWVARHLSPVAAGKAEVGGVEASLDDAQTHAEEGAEHARVRVWEAETALLPVEFAEGLVGARRRMRRFRQRIELCVKILAALEGVGRKVAPAALDRAKVALEKAEVAAAVEEKRMEAARVVREEREKKAAEREERKAGKMKERDEKGKRKSLEKKRRRQESAAALFMRRFVKRKADEEVVDVDRGACGRVGDGATKERKEVEEVVEEKALPKPENLDVMSASWWVLSEMEGIDVERVDEELRAGARKRWCGVGELKEHLQVCRKRRKAGEARVDAAMTVHRRQRIMHTDNRTPVFAKRRAEVRGQRSLGPIKLLQFHDDFRPAFFGTLAKKAPAIRPRRPLAKDVALDYSYDSADEWEDEDEDGEDLSDIEVDKERANEDAELRMLYGSDEEDDDDFLDDGDVEDDEDDDGDEGDTEGEDGVKSEGAPDIDTVGFQGGDAKESATGGSQPVVTDVTQCGKITKSPKRPGVAVSTKRRRKRRNFVKQSVAITDVSFPVDGVPSPLDRYKITVLGGAPKIVMFNPYISRVSEFLQESSASKPAPIRIPRTNLDDGVKLDLALTLVTASTRTSRDNIVYQFCESRKARGLTVPAKSEVVRAIREIGTNEKRKGDKRAGWYLNDEVLAAKLCHVHAVRSLDSLEEEAKQTTNSTGDALAVKGQTLMESCSPATTSPAPAVKQ